MRTLLIQPIVLVTVLAVGTLTWAFSDGPPDGLTGAPDEDDCTVCHTSFPLNSGNGMLAIISDSVYVPGDTHTIAIALSQAGQSRWGFEATVLDSNDSPVGEIVRTDLTNTQLSLGAGSRQYIKHILAGTFDGSADSSPGWTFAWVAPIADPGPVTLYVSGNAANSAAGNQGDYIYTTLATLTPTPPPPCCDGTTGNVNNDPAGDVTLTDLTLLVNHLFVTFESLQCPAEANTDGDAACELTLTDLTKLVNNLFVTIEPPADCSEFDPSLCD